MELDIDLAAAERTEAARQLIETAQSDGIVSLGVLGGMDLCILGGPKHPVLPETVAKAWLNLGDRARKKLIEDRTADMMNPRLQHGPLLIGQVRRVARPAVTAPAARRGASGSGTGRDRVSVIAVISIVSGSSAGS